MTTKKTTQKAKAAGKKADRGVTFDEMRRLMRIYGSMKCLRKRQKPVGEDMKVDSVKRKFYRWFPDLEERFFKDEFGVYRPKIGHEFELRYREEMRTKDGEILAKKRTRCRKERKSSSQGTKVTKCTKSKATPPSSGRVSPASAIEAPSSTPTPSSPIHEDNIINMDITLNMDHDLNQTSAAMIAADTEPVDQSFIAEKDIFDFVENNFFGQEAAANAETECQNVSQWIVCDSSSSDEEVPLADSNDVWDREPTMDSLLDKSIEECYEEILGSSDDDGSVSNYLFDMISS